jgi:hypothetical protein
VMGRVDVMAISRLWVRGGDGRRRARRAVERDERRVGRREANDVVHRASSSSSRGVVVAGKRGDRPNDTLARGADARDEGGDFLPRVE